MVLFSRHLQARLSGTPCRLHLIVLSNEKKTQEQKWGYGMRNLGQSRLVWAGLPLLQMAEPGPVGSPVSWETGARQAQLGPTLLCD